MKGSFNTLFKDEHIVFDSKTHQSVMLHPELQKRSFVIGSFGKTFHATGWKCGYCVGPANLMKEFRKVHQFMVFSVNTSLQHALAEYMQDASHYNGLESFYQEKRDYFRSLLEGSPFKILPCGSLALMISSASADALSKAFCCR